MTADARAVIDSMITWLDSLPSNGREPRTWREAHAAGLITDDDVVGAWLSSQATS